MINLTWILVWSLITILAWWLPASVTLLILLLNLIIADPIPYTDEIIMFIIALKQAYKEWKQKTNASDNENDQGKNLSNDKEP